MSNSNSTPAFYSISFSYRLGLGFHALNNEGSDGSNLMQPRRIDVGNTTYDGISGEIIRHHILENFVTECRKEGIPMLPMSQGLHPDRGPLGLQHMARSLSSNTTGVKIEKTNLLQSARRAISQCSVLDVGGYLAAFKESSAADKKPYIVERPYIQANCADVGDADPIKRDSCFDVAWLVSEEPMDNTVTQHSAYRPTADKNSRYAQVMRSNVYGGVIRADLHRIGMDDHWYLQQPTNGTTTERLAISSDEQLKRQKALIRAIINFIASPTGAKVAGWAPHVFLVEGAILHSADRTAPFVSPIVVDVSNKQKPVSFNSQYGVDMSAMGGKQGVQCWSFKSQGQLLGLTDNVLSLIPQSKENAVA